MPFSRQSLWAARRAIIAPACCIIAADHTNNLQSIWTPQTELLYPERDFNFRQVTLYEDLTYSLAALIYGVAVGWIGVVYLTLLHYAELWEMPVWLRGSFFLLTLCRPLTVLRWLWRKGQRTVAAARGNVSRWISLAYRLTRTALSVALVAFAAWLFLYSSTGVDVSRDGAGSLRVCWYASSPRLCEDMDVLLNVVAMGWTASFVGCGRMATLYFLWALGLPVAVRAVILVLALAVVVVGLLTKKYGDLERERAEQEQEQEEEEEEEEDEQRDNDGSADQRDPQANESIDPRLDPRTISADMRRRAEELAQLGDDIATTHAPEEHSAAISNAIQHDRAVEVAQVFARPLDTPTPTLEQVITDYFRFLTPPLSATERPFVRRKAAKLYVKELAAPNAAERRSWQRHMQYLLRNVRFSVLLERAGVAVLAENRELLYAAIVNGVVAAELDMVTGGVNVVVTHEDRAYAAKHLPALVQALVLNDHAGGYAKLRTRFQELQTEELQMRQEVASLVDGAQMLAWKKHESAFFAGLLLKLDVGARRERKERKEMSDVAQAQAGGSGGRGRGRRGEELRLV
ncbi:hypothetical protein BC567DRAFT_207552 [Phyllosticta citribraziliensis]